MKITGQWRVICDRCGKKLWSDQVQWETNKTGHRTFLVCDDCFDPVHPQEYVTGRRDIQTVPFSRPEATDTFIDYTDGSHLP